MLYGQVTPHGLGLSFYGDYLDLTSLRLAVYESIPDDEDSKGLNTYLLALCYDIRKAIQDCGTSFDVESFPLADGTMKTQPYRSVNITWPAFLYSLSTLAQLSAAEETSLELTATVH